MNNVGFCLALAVPRYLLVCVCRWWFETKFVVTWIALFVSMIWGMHERCRWLSGRYVTASFGAFWGLFWLMVASLVLLPRGWLLVRRSSGMSTIKVHEWCLVCYGWLIVCFCRNFHAFLPLQMCYMALLPWASSGFLCCIPNRWHWLAWTKLFS